MRTDRPIRRVELAADASVDAQAWWARIPAVKAVRLDNPDVILNALPVLNGDTDYVIADGPGSQTETSRALPSGSMTF